MANGIEFDEERHDYSNAPQGGAAGQSKMALWLIQHGLAKTPAAAQGVMIALAVVNLILCYVVIKYFL